MKSLTISAVALSLLGFASTGAQAQTKLFFYGDLERGNQPGIPPACVLQSQFKHLEKVVWRLRIQDETGKVLDDKGLKSVEVQLPDGQKFSARFGGHPPREPTDTLWAAAWIVPKDYPTGTFAYKVTATDLQGNSHSWEPFKVKASQLTILDGEIEIKK
jgi:hypothetical protein